VAGRHGGAGGVVPVRLEGRELGRSRVRRGGGGRDGRPGRPLVTASRLGRHPPARPRRPALLHEATTGFILTQLSGREGGIHIIGNVVFALGAVALLLVAVRVTRRSAGG
jgi:hypothetical protein